jgi:hypothetical protein
MRAWSCRLWQAMLEEEEFKEAAAGRLGRYGAIQPRASEPP